MRAALIGVALLAAAPARAAAPAAVKLTLAERQVVTLEFDRPVARVAVTDPDLLDVRARGSRVEVSGRRGGRASLEIAFEDGATVVYEVAVAPAARRAGAGEGAISLAVGEERRFRAPGVARVLVEENGVARVRVEGETVTVSGIAPGTTSVVLVDASGARTTRAIAVR
ncbi:MAG TPA: pilus assembly protein N-terminal domain-containing protein [Anaeromyxobacter sp.]